MFILSLKINPKLKRSNLKQNESHIQFVQKMLNQHSLMLPQNEHDLSCDVDYIDKY